MITIQRINPNDPISSAPEHLNETFELIETAINKLQSIIDTNTKIINLTDKSSDVPRGSVVVNALLLVGTTGNLISLNPNGLGEIFSVNYKGDIKCNTIITNSEDLSEITNLSVTDLNIVNSLNVEETIFMKGGIVENSTAVSITDVNIGGAATTPIYIADKKTIYLDYSNSGNALIGNKDVKIDISEVKEGQIFKFICLRTNISKDQRLYNGNAGNEIFATINPTGNGFNTLLSTSQPKFVPTAEADKNISYVVAQWTNVGSGIYKFVILEYKNMEGIQ